MDGQNDSSTVAPQGTTSRCITFIVLLLCTVIGGCSNIYALWRLFIKDRSAKKHPCITNLSSVSVLMCLVYIPLQMTDDFLYIFHAYSRPLVLFKSVIWECCLWVYCLTLSGVALQRMRIIRIKVGKRPGPGLEIAVCVAAWATGLLLGCGNMVEMSQAVSELYNEYIMPSGSVADRVSAVAFSLTLAVFSVAYPSMVWSSRSVSRTTPAGNDISLNVHTTNVQIEEGIQNDRRPCSRPKSKHTPRKTTSLDLSSVTLHIAKQMLQISGLDYPESPLATSVEQFNLPLFDQVPRRKSSLDVSQIYTIRKTSQVSQRTPGRFSIPGCVGNEDENGENTSVTASERRETFSEEDMRVLRMSRPSCNQYAPMWHTGVPITCPSAMSMTSSSFTLNALSTGTNSPSTSSSSNVFFPQQEQLCRSPSGSPVQERPTTMHSLMPPRLERSNRGSDRSARVGRHSTASRANRHKSRSYRIREGGKRCLSLQEAAHDYQHQVPAESLQGILPPLRHERLTASGNPINAVANTSAPKTGSPSSLRFPSQVSMESSHVIVPRKSILADSQQSKGRKMLEQARRDSTSRVSFSSTRSRKTSLTKVTANACSATGKEEEDVKIDFYQFLHEMDVTGGPPISPYMAMPSSMSNTPDLAESGSSSQRSERYLRVSSDMVAESPKERDTLCSSLSASRCRVAAVRALAHFLHLLLLAPLALLRAIGLPATYDGLHSLFSFSQCSACICFTMTPLIYIFMNKGIVRFVRPVSEETPRQRTSVL